MPIRGQNRRMQTVIPKQRLFFFAVEVAQRAEFVEPSVAVRIDFFQQFRLAELGIKFGDEGGYGPYAGTLVFVFGVERVVQIEHDDALFGINPAHALKPWHRSAA